MTNEQLSDLLDGHKSVNVYSFSYDDENEEYKVLTTDLIDQIIDPVDVKVIVPFGAFHIFVFNK